MKNSLVEDNSTGRKPDWDVEAAEDLGTGQPAGAGKSPYRHTTTPQPASTHGGIADAGGVKAGAAPVEEFGADFPAAFDESFPAALGKCYNILRAVRALPERNRKQANEKARRGGLISAHIRKISNPPAAIHISADEAAKVKIAHHQRPQWMAARLDELVKYLASPPTAELASNPASLLEDNDTPSEARQKLSADPKQRLCGHPAVLQCVQLAKKYACRGELFSIENHDIIYPADHVRLLEHELHTSQSPERVRILQAEIARVNSSIAAGTSEVGLRGMAQSKWAPVLDALRSAIAVSQLLVATWRLDAVLVERDWFSEFVMERQETPLSGQFTSLLAELEALTVNQQTLHWFGVKDCAESDE
jgi:hypothetical protein